MTIGRPTIITSDLIDRIKYLKNQGLTINAISKKTGVSRSTIYKVLKSHLKYQSVFPLKQIKKIK